MNSNLNDDSEKINGRGDLIRPASRYAFAQPPVPPTAELRHFPDMPLDVARLRDSRMAMADGEVFRCFVLLCCAAWHQVPAGSLPDDEAELCRLAGLGRDRKTWRKVRDAVLRGWVRFSDGRLYHRVVCEKVIAGLNSSAEYRWAKAGARVRKENGKRRKSGMEVLPTPEKPTPLAFTWPDPVEEREPDDTVHVPEREFPPERKGMDTFPLGVVDGRPSGTGKDHLPDAASGEGAGGPPARDEVRAIIDRLTACKRGRA